MLPNGKTFAARHSKVIDYKGKFPALGINYARRYSEAMTIRSVRELLSRSGPDGDVRHALRGFNLGMSGRRSPPSAALLARELGFELELVPMARGERGRLVTEPFSENGYRIEVNERDDVRVRRWTVLHEIMHWLLHRRDDPFATDQFRAVGNHFYDADELREEREANEFVEALIFGDGALEAAHSMFGEDHDRLAAHFGVTQITLRRALRKL